MKTATYEQFDAITRTHLAIFTQRVFADLNPGTEYLDNFDIHVLIDELEALRFGRQRRLAAAKPQVAANLGCLCCVVARAASAWIYASALELISSGFGMSRAGARRILPISQAFIGPTSVISSGRPAIPPSRS